MDGSGESGIGAVDDGLVRCPSGLSGRVRGMKGRELREILDGVGSGAEAAVTRVLNACWLETVDHGVYPESFDWADGYAADRFYALFQIRRATYPDHHLYQFDVDCGVMACRAKIKWQVDLNDLEVKQIPESTLETLLGGTNSFETELSGGVVVKHKLLTGRDLEAQPRIAKNIVEKGSTAGLAERRNVLVGAATRITAAPGVTGNPPSVKQILAFLDDLPLADMTRLVDSFDDVDFGVRVEIEVLCPDCGGTTKLQLPFERGFFLPTRAAL